MENAKYQWGSKVVAISDIINDGSYPNKAEDEMIVAKGETGLVRQIGQDEEKTTYLYIVEFGDRLVGCFEDELTPSSVLPQFLQKLGEVAPKESEGVKHTLEQFYKLTTAEEYLEFFEISYDQSVVHVNRLHILKKFSQLRNEIEAALPANISDEDRLERYGNAMHEAYITFLSSSGVKEKLFKVFHDQQQAVSFVSFSDIKKG